jgi:hypothetical protein
VAPPVLLVDEHAAINTQPSNILEESRVIVFLLVWRPGPARTLRLSVASKSTLETIGSERRVPIAPKAIA